MANNTKRLARINSQRFTHVQNMETLKTNLFNCNSIEQREFINKKGEHKLYVLFHFANGVIPLSIDPTDEVRTLVNDFMQNTGVFANQSEAPNNVRNEKTQ